MRKCSYYFIIYLLIALSTFIAAPILAQNADSLRLDKNVIPIFQTIKLNIVPNKSNYTGSVHIDLQVREETNAFRFHAEDLMLDRIVLKEEKAVINITHDIGEKGLVSVTSSMQLVPGKYMLDIDFSNE